MRWLVFGSIVIVSLFAMQMLASGANAVATPEAVASGAAYVNPSPGREIAYQIPGMHKAKVRRNIPYRRVNGRTLKLDVYSPPNRRAPQLPAVVFVHGTTSAPDAKDWGIYVGWGQLAAANGLVGVTFAHRSQGDAPAASDVKALIAYVRANASKLGIDPGRLCVAAYSGGVPSGLQPALEASPPYVRCVVAYYGLLDLPEAEARYSATTYLRQVGAKFPPILIGKAGYDSEATNASIDRFVSAAKDVGAEVALWTHPRGQHGFDLRNHDARSRQIIKQTLVFLRKHLNR